LRFLLGDCVHAVGPTGVATFNIQGYTLHSLLIISIKGDFKELQGQWLHEIQQSLANKEYLIIDEVLMVARILVGCIKYFFIKQIPCLCLVFGDFGQLSPVMDLPLFTTVSCYHLPDQAYQQFHQAIVLKQVCANQHLDQVLF